MDSFYTQEELSDIGFKSFGKDVWISRKASIYKSEAISLGHHVRVDDFCLLSGGVGIALGNYVHLSAYSALFGGAGIEIGDFSGLSPRVSIFSESDDFSGNSMISPFFSVEKYKPGYISAPVKLERYVQVGASSTLLPGVLLAEGVVVGAHSLVVKDCASWGIYAGVPVRRIKERDKRVLEYRVEEN